MKSRFDIRYVDRRTGSVRVERVFAEPLLYALYNTSWGVLLNRLVVQRRSVSRLYGWWQRRAWTRRRVARFVKDFEIDLRELDRHPSEYASFAEFFTRSIDPAQRPVDATSSCVAPCDGKVLVYPRVRRGQRFAIKRCEFELDALLDDAGLAREYDGGAMLVSRLALCDYHHFHFPADGTPGPARSIPGLYHAGGPYALTRLTPFYRENHRMVTRLRTERVGRMLMVEVGALTVGSIQQDFLPGRPVRKGEHKGYFGLGGSTIVLLSEPGRIEFDADLLDATRRGLETFVRMGEPIGRPPSAH